MNEEATPSTVVGPPPSAVHVMTLLRHDSGPQNPSPPSAFVARHPVRFRAYELGSVPAVRLRAPRARDHPPGTSARSKLDTSKPAVGEIRWMSIADITPLGFSVIARF